VGPGGSPDPGKVKISQRKDTAVEKGQKIPVVAGLGGYKYERKRGQEYQGF